METLQIDFDQMKTEYDTLLEVHKQVLLERDSLQADLEVFQGASTPRPDWECCAGTQEHERHFHNCIWNLSMHCLPYLILGLRTLWAFNFI